MTARTMAPLVTRPQLCDGLAPNPSELTSAMQACAFRLAETAPSLETVADCHAFMTHVEGLRRYAQLLAQALGQQAAE